MKRGRRGTISTIAILVGILLLLFGVAACSDSSDEEAKVLGLLEDPKVGLAHLNDEFHTIKGEDLLANPEFGLAHLNDEFHTIKGTLADPKFGLAHLNDEFHTIKGTLADPKFGLAHLNDEFHTIKQILAELSQQVESLRQQVQASQR